MYELTTSSFLNRLLRLVLWVAHLPLLLAVLWVIGLFFCLPECALLLVPFVILIMWRLSQKKLQHVRTWIAFFCLAEFGFFLALPGPDVRHWQEGTAQASTIDGPVNNIVHLNFIRDFIYHGRKPADIRYLEEDFNIQDITGVYLAECVSGKGLTDCSLMLSFAFRDGRYLVVSPEMRIPAGEEVNELRKHYKNYGLFYLFGTEEDIFAQHTDERHDYLSLYPLKADLGQAQAMLSVCLDLACEARGKHRAYHPLQQTYYNDLLEALRLICPELKEGRPIHNANVAKLLYRNGATAIPEKGDWSLIRRRYALGFNIRPEVREAYSDVIRRRFDGIVRETLPERHVQDISKDELLSKRTEKPVTPSTPAGLSVTSPLSVNDIPEPTARLANDKAANEQTTPAEATPETADGDTAERKEEKASEADSQKVLDKEDSTSVAAATRELDKNEQILSTVRTPSAADYILEPGARLHADDRKEEEEDEAMRESRARSTEGRDIMDDDKAKKNGASQFNELFFGKRKSGITIIEKEKPKEEAHPLDPIRKRKRHTPFDEEDKKQQPQSQQEKEEDPFTPKAPIKI